MKKIFHIILTVICLSGGTSLAGAEGDVQTMLHTGHPVQDYSLSYDGKYLFTRGNTEICVWDLTNFMLVKSLQIKTPYISAHPADSRLIYVLLNDRLNSRLDVPTFAIIDWTDGETIGYVNFMHSPERNAFCDVEIIRVDKDQLIVAPSISGFDIPQRWIGGQNIDIGTAKTNYNDSLLVTSGLFPQIWDLKHARLLGDIEYFRYLQHRNPNGSSDFMRLPYRKNFKPAVISFCEARFLPGTNDIILGGVRDTISIWEITEDNSTRLKREIPVGNGPSPILSINGDTIVAATERGLFRSIGFEPFEKLPEIGKKVHTNMFNTVSRPFGNGRFLAGNNVETGMVPANLIECTYEGVPTGRISDNKKNYLQSIKIAPSEDYAVVTFGFKGIACVDLSGDTLRFGPEMRTSWLDGESITDCEILPGDIIAAGSNLGSVKFWRKGDSESFAQKRIHNGKINSLTVSNDSTKLFSADKSGQITIWDTKTLEPIMSIYRLRDEDKGSYIFITPDHYYKSTPTASRHINFVKDNIPYSFEQFDYRNNRPDIILERLGGDPEEIELLHKAWLKRLRRAEIDPASLSTDFHVPTTTLLNRKEIPTLTDKDAVRLNLEFSDDLYNLNSISVNINGVPVLDKSAQKVTGKKKSMVLELPLSKGTNEIDVSCTNEKGATSLSERVIITSNPPNSGIPDIYVVSVGVSDYRDKAYNLNYADKDARDFAETVVRNKSDKFGRVKDLLLTDEAFNEGGMERIKEFLKPARRDDVVLLFYAGHGVLDSELDYYLARSDMDFSHPEKVGVAYEDFIGLLEGTASLNRYVFIDACHSGEFDKEDYIAMNTTEIPGGEELVFRAAGNSVRAKEDVEKVNAIINDSFMDLRRSQGATVLSSAGGGELAVEGSKWKNGLFTYCLKKGMESKEADADNDGHLTLKEWIDYTKNRVTELSEGRQSPNLRSNNYHNKLTIK